MLTTETRVLTLPEYLAALPWEVREDLANHLQVTLLAVGLVAQGYNDMAPGTLTLSQVQRLLATAAAGLEVASAGLRSQDAGGPRG